MDRELTITPLLLNHQPHPSSNAWVKLLIYEPTEPDVVATRGKMYAVLSLASKAEIDFTPLMGLIIETLHQRYFGVTEGGILQVLESALDAIHKQLLLAGQQDKRLSAGFSFDILVAVNWGTVLYLGQLGSSRACLVRQDKLHDIDEGDQKTRSAYLSSGVVQAGDRFLLATSQLLGKFNRKQILHHLSLGTDTMAQSLEQQLNHSANSLESGIILLVDIKQVPSLEDESLQILNADTMAPPPRLPSTLKHITQATDGALQSSKSAAVMLWQWRLFGKLPGLPLLIILASIALLLGSIAIKYTRTSPAATTNMSPTIVQLEDKLNQAQQVASVNPDRATDLLNQMEPLLSQALQASQDARLRTIEQQRQQLQDQLLNIQVLSPHPIAQFSGTISQPKLVQFGQNIYLIDSKSQQLIKTSGDSLRTVASSNKLFTRSALLTATSVGLVVTQPQEVASLDQDGKPRSTKTIPAEKVVGAASYQQNAYALAADGQLYKLVNQSGALQEASSYFQTPIKTTGLVDVAIDGAVYILRQDGSVEKYLSGQRRSLVLERAVLAKNATAIITNEDTDAIYILSSRSLLAWSKEGQYRGQYRLPDSAPWQAATVDGQQKTLYILTEGKLVEAKLPQ